MSVRLAPQPSTVGAVPPEPEIPAAAPQVKRPAPVSDREASAITAATAVPPVQDAPPPALPQAADPTYYPARELDAYPRPVVPPELDRIAASGSVTLALLIDEQGAVNNVAFAGPAAPEHLREALRAVLVATRFLPARKDGRVVKSRIVLSVDFGQGMREP
jgi:outer membrane biosynthesis protein TonB